MVSLDRYTVLCATLKTGSFSDFSHVDVVVVGVVVKVRKCSGGICESLITFTATDFNRYLGANRVTVLKWDSLL